MMHPMLITTVLLATAVSAQSEKRQAAGTGPSSAASASSSGPASVGSSSLQSLLQQQFGGQVKLIGPVAQPCFSKFSGSYCQLFLPRLTDVVLTGSLNSPSYNAEQCANVQQLYLTNSLVSEPGFYTQPMFANCQARAPQGDCELDWSNSVSAIVVKEILLSFLIQTNPAAYSQQTCYQGNLGVRGVKDRLHLGRLRSAHRRRDSQAFGRSDCLCSSQKLQHSSDYQGFRP
jgi:hypothetical protein